MYSLKQDIYNKIQIKPSNQILLTLEGTQLKDQDDLDQDEAIVLFNRRLLKQDPYALLIPTEGYEEECKKILLPSLKEMETHLLRNNPTELNSLTKVKHYKVKYYRVLVVRLKK
jgi:hypothetical protein